MTPNRSGSAIVPAIASVLVLSTSVALSALCQRSPWRDSSGHTVRFVTVAENVALEVLDWGGTGLPLVLLAGGGNTAHVFDEFAPKLASDHHVYGITRRGFGASGFSVPDDPLERLRDDLLAALDALDLKRPVLVGHSIAGAELSALATSHPTVVAGLVYLDAGYPYAFDNGQGPTMTDFQQSGPRSPRPAGSDLESFSALQKWHAEVYGVRLPEAEFRQTWEADESGRPRKMRDSPGSQMFAAILKRPRRWATIPSPVLAIFASPHVPERWIDTSADPIVQDAAKSYLSALDDATERQVKAFENGVPSARVVRLRGAHHVFLSNEADALREIRSFLVRVR